MRDVVPVHYCGECGENQENCICYRCVECDGEAYEMPACAQCRQPVHSACAVKYAGKLYCSAGHLPEGAAALEVAA